jgi:hypothetical protein
MKNLEKLTQKLSKSELQNIFGGNDIGNGGNTYCYCMDGTIINDECIRCWSRPCLNHGGAKGVCITFEND